MKLRVLFVIWVIATFVWACTVVRFGSAATPTPYAPLAQSEFATLVPAVPVDAGGESRKAWDRVASTPSPSILPSGRPPRVVPSLTGTATWYAYNAGQAAAAKPLRDFLGAGWRGAFARVCHYGLCLRIRLTDSEASLLPGRVIDLDASDFRRICGPLSIGVCDVTVSR